MKTPRRSPRSRRCSSTIGRSPATFDTVFFEDDKPWIQDSPKGALAVLLLRRIAYNLLALFRSVTQRSEERRRMPWAALLRGFAYAFVAVTDVHLAALRTRNIAAALD